MFVFQGALAASKMSPLLLNADVAFVLTPDMCEDAVVRIKAYNARLTTLDAAFKRARIAASFIVQPGFIQSIANPVLCAPEDPTLFTGIAADALVRRVRNATNMMSGAPSTCMCGEATHWRCPFACCGNCCFLTGCAMHSAK